MKKDELIREVLQLRKQRRDEEINSRRQNGSRMGSNILQLRKQRRDKEIDSRRQNGSRISEDYAPIQNETNSLISGQSCLMQNDIPVFMESDRRSNRHGIEIHVNENNDRSVIMEQIHDEEGGGDNIPLIDRHSIQSRISRQTFDKRRNIADGNAYSRVCGHSENAGGVHRCDRDARGAGREVYDGGAVGMRESFDNENSGGVHRYDRDASSAGREFYDGGAEGGSTTRIRNNPAVTDWLEQQQQMYHNDDIFERPYVSHGNRQFSFTDVESSFYRFHGAENQNFEKWVNHFESHADIYQWNQLQRFVYAKRLLDGAAKKFAASEEFCGSWRVMKIAFNKEFCRPVSSATIHARLNERFKKENETYLEYVYAMKEIAMLSAIDESSICEYIVKGIREEEEFKGMLYDIKSVSELKNRLESYEKMKIAMKKNVQRPVKNTHEKENGSTKAKVFKKTSDTPLTCFGCNKTGHIRRNCPDNSKIQRCSHCSAVGHLASSCDKAKRSESFPCKIQKRDVTYVELNILGNKTFALFDSGSDVTLMREDYYVQIGSPMLNQVARFLTGLGGKQISTKGVFKCNVLVQNQEFIMSFFLVATDALSMHVVIGKDLLKIADVYINADGVQIKKRIGEINYSEKLSTIEENHSNDIQQVMQIACENDELDVCSIKYSGEIKQMVTEYKPKRNVNTQIETRVILKDDIPIYERARRLAPLEREVLRKQVAEWLKDGIIRPSHSEYASPVVLVKKKNGEYRVCIDYRRLNKKTVKDRYPLPLIEDQIDHLAGANVYTTIDMKNGFFHVPVEEKSKKFTAFITPDGLYEFNKTPFGFCNSPASFGRFVRNAFNNLVREHVLMFYVDDIIIPAVDEDEGFEKLKKFLSVAAENGIQINWQKCHFLQRKVEFLGHVIENSTVSPSLGKINAVMNFPEPCTIKQLQGFLGLSGFFRKYIEGFSKIARPLTELLKKNTDFVFSYNEKKAFNDLKVKLSQQPVLKIYDPSALTELHTDACQDGYGAVLMQKYVGEPDFLPVYYFSKKTTPAESKYDSYQLETHAVIKALEKFRVYLLGIRFKIVTDCQALEKTLHKKEVPTKVARWALMLEEYDYEIEHRSGSKMRHVDALSRAPVLIIESTISSVLSSKQKEDEKCQSIMKILEKAKFEDFLVEGGVLKRFINGKNVVYIPLAMRRDLVRNIHIENGHFGLKKLQDIIESDYFIPKLSELVKDVISCCVPCILANRKRGRKEGELQPIPKGDTPLSTLHIDHLGPMDETSKQYRYILAVIDGFTKFVWLFPTKTTGVIEVLAKLRILQSIFGNPDRIITDRGGAFLSIEFKKFCEDENITLIHITTGVPRGNGQVERIHQMTTAILTKMTIEKPSVWFKNVDKVQRCLNSTFQRSIRMSPFELMFGKKMKQLTDISIGEVMEEEEAEMYYKDRSDTRAQAKLAIQEAQEEQRIQYNKFTKKAPEYKVNDLVAIKKTQLQTTAKTKAKYMGPYRIVKITGKNRYEVEKIGNVEGPFKTSSCADHMKRWSEWD